MRDESESSTSAVRTQNTTSGDRFSRVAGAGPCLILRSSYGGERTFPLSKNRTLMGRGTACDLRVALPMVDDRHCEVVFLGGELRVRDLSRADGQGTLHNGQRVKETPLAHDDTLTLGPVTFTVRMSPNELRPIKG